MVMVENDYQSCIDPFANASIGTFLELLGKLLRS